MAHVSNGQQDSQPPAGTRVAGSVEQGASGAPGAPGTSEHIQILTNEHRVRVIHQGITVADTLAALTVSEAGLPEMLYLPRADVNMARLERSEHTSRCPHKGEASYFHLRTEDGLVENAAWSYEAPFEAAQPIKDYLAFYASRVDRIDQTS